MKGVVVAQVNGEVDFKIFKGIALKKGFTAMGNGIKTACRAIGNFFKTLGAKINALFTKKK